MKRFALAFAALALTGAAAFADAPPVQVTISDWGRQVFAVGNLDTGNGYFAGLGTSWGTTPRIVGLNIQANYQYGGFSITPQADNGSFGLTDQNKAWVSPLPGLTAEAGINLETDTWRGASDFGSDDWLRFLGNVQQNSVTFARLGEGGHFATDLNYNKDGIGAWVLVDGLNGSSQTYTNDLGSALQAGAAYTIPSVVTIKAQFLGSNTGANLTQASQSLSTGTWSHVQGALNFSPLVKGLNEEVGVDVPTNAANAGYVFEVADITDFTISPVTLHAVAQVIDYNGNQAAASAGSGYGVALGGGLDYDLGNKVLVDFDVRYGNALSNESGLVKTNTNVSSSSDILGGSFGIAKSFDHGTIGIGFEYSSGLIASATYPGATNGGSAHWAIPLKLEESF